MRNMGVAKKILVVCLCMIILCTTVLRPIASQKAEAASAVALSATAYAVIAALIAMLGYHSATGTQTDTDWIVRGVGVYLSDDEKLVLNSVPPPSGGKIDIAVLLGSALFAGIMVKIHDVLSNKEITSETEVYDISDMVYQDNIFSLNYQNDTVSFDTSSIPPSYFISGVFENTSLDVTLDGNVTVLLNTLDVSGKTRLYFSFKLENTTYLYGSVLDERDNFLCLAYYNGSIRFAIASILSLIQLEVKSVPNLEVATETGSQLVPVYIEPGAMTFGSIVSAIEKLMQTQTSVEISEETGTKTQADILEETGIDTKLDPTTSPDLNKYKSVGLSDVFPFCIPFDVYAIVSGLAAAREAPQLDISWHIPVVNIDFEYNASLEDFDGVASLLRSLELMAFCVGLAILTGKVIKW